MYLFIASTKFSGRCDISSRRTFHNFISSGQFRAFKHMWTFSKMYHPINEQLYRIYQEIPLNVIFLCKKA